MRSERKSGSWVLLLATLCWVVGWGMAVGYGQGFEIQRMVVAIPGVGLAGLLVLPGLVRGRAVWWPGLIAVGLAGVYFVWRALASPVWDLARLDLLPVCLGLVSVLVGARVAGPGRAVGVLLAGLVLLFLANAGVAVIQKTSDPSYAFLRMPRVDQHGVSGLFWHRNYLAGMLELVVPVFLGVAFALRRSWLRIGFGCLAAAGLVLGYLSSSRGGLLAIGVGCTVSFVVWLMCGWQARSKNAKMGLVVGGVVAALVLVAGTVTMASKVSVKRGQSEILEAAATESGVRLALVGSAYDQWLESPVIGTGARTFSYLVNRNWVRGRTDVSLGNPEMAHNDYLQTLAEYGLVGFGLTLLVLGLGLGRGAQQVWTKWSGGASLRLGVQLGAVGGICGAMVHAGVDFSLHVLPNALLFCFLIGAVFHRGEPVKEEGGMVSRFLAGGFGLLLIVVGVGGAFAAGKRELAVLPKWFRFEQEVIEAGHPRGRRPELKAIIEEAPSFELARFHGRMVMGELQGGAGSREALLAEGLWAMKLAVERHPYDGESRLVYANFLELDGDDEGAMREYLAGIEATWRREEKFGSLAGFSDHLARRGEEYFQERKPERALAFFQRAQEYLERSWELKFRGDGWGGHAKKVKVLKERVEFLVGAGIVAEDVEGEIPPPPEE